MENLKHTKGKWESVITGMNPCVRNSNRNKIAELYYVDHLMSQEEIDANAKLISAAPDMLETLIEIREWYEKNHKEYFGEYTPICFSKGLSAIKKATI